MRKLRKRVATKRGADKTRDQLFDNLISMERLLDKYELAQLVGISPRTVEKWVYMKKIPFVKIRGGMVRFNLREAREAILGRSIDHVNNNVSNEVGVAEV
jgi:excisionase family DNA binding protein